MNTASESASVDLFMSHVEPLATLDVYVEPSADLVLLEEAKNGMEIVLETSAAPKVKVETPGATVVPESGPAKAAVAAQAARTFLDAGAAFRTAMKDLRDERSEAAKRILERLVRDHPASSEYLAGLSMARFQLSASEVDRLAEANRLVEAAKAYAYCVTTKEMLGRMFRRLNRPASAARYFKEAAELEPSRSDLLAELRTMNALVEAEKKFADAPVLPLVRQSTPVRRAQASADHRKLDNRAVPIAVGVFLAVAAVLFVGSNILHLGVRELFLEPMEPFFWIRQSAMLAFGTGGAILLLKRRPIANEELAFSPIVLMAALSLGLFMGMLLPLSMSHTPIAMLIGMIALQVVAEEVFFRAYLGRVLARGTVGTFAPVMISALLYGAYQLTYVAVWSGGALDATALGRAGAAVLAGAVFALLQVKSGSLSAPLIAHTAAATVVLIGSAY